jgi:hypothetical protein
MPIQTLFIYRLKENACPESELRVLTPEIIVFVNHNIDYLLRISPTPGIECSGRVVNTPALYSGGTRFKSQPA